MSEIKVKTGRGGARVGAGRKPASTQPRMQEGWYVYVLCETPRTQYVKIGIANKPYQRLASAQTCNPRLLVYGALWSLGGSDAYAAVERALHQTLRPFHVRGEWFEVAVEEIERHLNDIALAYRIEAIRVM